MKKKERTKNWFSNMLPLDKPIVYQGNVYYTVENFYQALKFTSVEERAYVASLNPYKAKRYAKGKEPSYWGDVKLGIMEHALRLKFEPGTSWHKKLMSTKGLIVEWNNWGDTYWGVDVRYGIGHNYLGQLLMKIRKEFRNANHT